MPFMYTPLFDASASNLGRVLCISFSRLGKYAVVAASNCLTVWNIDEGTPLVDDLRMFSDPLSVTWISGLIFVVGCSDGSLFSLQVIPEEQRVKLFGFFASDVPIRHLSSNGAGSVLVSAGLSEICTWVLTISHQSQIHWVLQNTSAGPDQEGVMQKLVSLACFVKLEHRLRSLMVHPRVSGALLNNETSAMTVNVNGDIQILNFETGVSIKLEKSRNIPAAVRFIHGQHLIVIGGDGRADIVDAETMHKMQTLWHVEKKDTSTFSRSLSWHLPRQLLEEAKKPKIDILSILSDSMEELLQ
ncbi:hypothetical protein HYPSUDRAFT_53990 [Hypholoma sublateritium FD-334 SS-4]|uniref:Anaphase-promoting complex subunit 4 WD40 domain-containing protein n=1 Tax=Hypholoma sublateritium (strain FD-334 SS-4) TaxID=945553 RepID=A0A0D2NZM7_HYPSF|nr:hypothetical protein HYPSUDRAFT_53990 [Hypholoma sublateritium FD-334 SS-4]